MSKLLLSTCLLVYIPFVIASELTTLFKMSLQELLDVKVTISTLSEQTLAESASSVTVYTREDIRRMGISSLEELLNYVPGVQTARTQKDGISETPIFRGRGGQHGSSPNILLMLDGRRMNSHVFGGAFGQQINNLDWIKQIEIIRGPGSTLYGANAFNGVVNLVSEIQENEVNVRVGELGLTEASIQYRHSWDELALEVYLHDYSDNGEDYLAFYNFLGSFEDTQDPRARETAAFNLSYKDWYYKSYYSRSVSDDFVNGSTQGNGINRSDDRFTSFRLGYKGLRSKDWNMDFYFDSTSGVSDYFARIIPLELASIIWWTDGSMVDAIGGNHLRWKYDQIGSSGHYNVSEQHELTFGVEYRDEWVDVNPFHGNWDPELMESSQGAIILPCDCISRGFWLPGLRADLLLESDRKVFNGWIQDQWQYSENLSVTIGLRHDDYDDFGGHTSLRGSLIYHQSDQQQFKVLYGEAFRAPTFAETRAFVSSNFVGNPDLLPELISTVDLVWSRVFDSSNFVLTWSKSHIEDEIRLVLFEDVLQPGIFAFQPQNAGRSELSNWELEFNSTLSDSLIFRAGYTHHIQYAEQGVAQDLVFMALNYNAEKLNINLNGFYHDRILSREANGDNFLRDIYLDDFWRFNITTNYSLNDRFNLNLRVENLFDEAYKTFSTADSGLEFGIPSRGRTVSIGFNWNF